MLSPNSIVEWIGGASDDQCATLVAAVERRQAQLKCAAQSIGLTVTVPPVSWQRVCPVQVVVGGGSNL